VTHDSSIPEDNVGPYRIEENASEQAAYFTERTSTIVRSLSITAIAITWLFAGGLTIVAPAVVAPMGVTVESPEMLVRALKSTTSLEWSLVAALLALLFDFLQYVWESLAWLLYRWSLGVILRAKHPASLTSREIRAWRVAWAFRIARRIEDLSSGELGRKTADGQWLPWADRRTNLINALTSLPQTKASRRFRDSRFSPATISRPAGLLYVAKIAAIAASYGALLVFVLAL
jgi:hypothetical protein